MKTPEVHTESTLQRWRKGFKLGAISDASTSYAPALLSNVMAQPFNVFMTNHDSAFTNINDSTTETCGCDSPLAARGKKAIDFFDRKNAEYLERFNTEVFTNECITLHDYDLHCKDGSIKHVLTFRAPWYDDNNPVIESRTNLPSAFPEEEAESTAAETTKQYFSTMKK